MPPLEEHGAKVSILPRRIEPGQISEFRSIRYLGNKRKLTGTICAAIEAAASEGNQVTDLFAGSCSVSFQMKRTHQVLSNDNQLYSYHLAKAIVENERVRISSGRAVKELRPVYLEHVAQLSSKLENRLAQEEALLTADCDDPKALKRYAAFCRQTPHIGRAGRALDMSDLIRAARSRSQDRRRRNPWVLFTAYFSNAYFGLQQCIQIDAIRRSIEEAEIVSHGWRNHLYLAALMYSLSESVSAPGHFAQYLKPASPYVYARLQRERKKSIWQAFLGNLTLLSSFVIQTPFDHRATCKDWNVALRARKGKSRHRAGVIYADPPYTADHYSRFYHILNTLVQYDYPASVGAGRYPEGRSASRFSMASTGADEFESLVRTSARLGSSLILSYSNSGLLTARSILAISRRHFEHVTLRWTSHAHSSQGRHQGETEGRPRREYLISCSRPR